jgi:hypothetical protein
MNIEFNKSSIIFLFVFLLSFIFMLGYVLSLNNLDYIWNYGFAVKINQGLIPYRDFDILQTPLSFYITAFFLKIFGNYSLVYIMLGACAVALMYYLFYCISQNISGNRRFSIAILLVCILYTLANLTIYNYNSLSIILILSIILCEFKDRRNIKNNVIIGLLLGLLFLTKQNISAVTVLLMTFNILCCRASIGDKANIIFLRAGACLFPIVVYLIYLSLHGALYDFFDHTILGIIDFSNGNKFSDSNAIFLYLIIPAIIILKSIFMLIKEKRYDLDDKLFIVLVYSLAGLSMLYPALDILHLTIGVIISFLLINFVYPPEDIASNRFLIICSLILAGVFISSVVSLIRSEDKISQHPGKYYQFIPIEREFVEHLTDIGSYIKNWRAQGRQVVIVDNTGMLYQFESGMYDDRLDMLVQGNVGYNGVEKIIGKFKRTDDGTIFLVGKTKKLFEMTELKMFVVCNYQYIETIPKFYVYEKGAVSRYQTTCHSDIADSLLIED